MIPWILQTETSKHCLLKLKLGKLGEGVCGRGEGWSRVLGHSRFFFFFFSFSFCFWIFRCLCTSVPYKRRKLSPWCPPGSTKGLRNACNSNTQPNNQKEYSNHAFALKTWDMFNVYCILNKQKVLWPLTSLVEQPYGERRNLVMFPTTIFFPPSPFSSCCWFVFFPCLSTWIRWTCMSV